MHHSSVIVNILRTLVILILIPGATDVLASPAVPLDGTITLPYLEIKKLLPSEPGPFFGYSVAMDGDTLAVGVPYDSANGEQSGAVYIFQRDWEGPGNWGQVARLTPGDPAPGDFFGRNVDISGDRVVVGAPYDDGIETDSGSAYIFERDQGGLNAWGQVAKLAASDARIFDNFGWSVAVDEDTVIVGSYIHSPGGQVYIFEQDFGGPGNWGETTLLSPIGGGFGLGFGISIDIEGDTLVAGAYSGGDYSGYAHIFQRQIPRTGWDPITKVTGHDTEPYYFFGYSVAISGDLILAGAPGHNGLIGAAYIFQRHQGGYNHWGESAHLIPSDGASQDYFAIEVALDGEIAFVASPYHHSETGAAYVYHRDQGGTDQWGQLAELVGSDATAGDIFGYWVALEAETLVAGSPGQLPDGAAYLFSWQDTPPSRPEISLLPNPPQEGSPVDLFGWFTDPDPGENFTTTVGWGDGSTISTTLGSGFITYTFHLSHTFLDGPFTGTLGITITDHAGASASFTHTFSVRNVAPVVQAGPDLALTVGQPLTQVGSFSDPGADTWSAIVDYGSGTGPQPLILDGNQFHLTYIYTQPGVITITVTVSDDDNGLGTDTLSVSVTPPTFFTHLPFIRRE